MGADEMVVMDRQSLQRTQQHRGMIEVGVDLDQITHSFGRHTALEDVSLQFGAGVFGLLGPNGAGKSTLLRIMATVLKPKRGEVRLLGMNPNESHDLRSIRRELGYLPQQFGYYPNFSVFEFIEYFALLKEMSPKRVRPAVANAIERVGLEDRAKTKMKSLSGGMLRRVGIAQAIVNEPALLLLDEPTVGLDPEQRVLFRRLLREIGGHSTVFVSTHLVEDVAAACSDVRILNEGRVVYAGDASDLKRIGAEVSGGDAAGDSEIERGYTSVLMTSRQGKEAR
jgi:ABC-type multidrug transport system ATPase subunit